MLKTVGKGMSDSWLMHNRILAKIRDVLLLILFQSSFCCLFAQVPNGHVIKGTVTDSYGSRLKDVSVAIKGINTGSVTAEDGSYTINAPSLEDTLTFSFIGYQTENVAIAGRAEVNLKLANVSKELDQVIVLAYNTSSKRKLTSAVTNVDVKQIETMAGYQNLGSALQGRVAGVMIANSHGGPDASASISIRGGGAPMYIIDGVIANAGLFNMLNPQDIETMSVMKDAASSAVYGATAANGIIVVTTKKGRVGRARINYISDAQFNTPMVVNSKLTSLQYAELRNTISDYMGSARPYSDLVLAKIKSGIFPDYPDNDWWDILVKKYAYSQRHTLTLDGGDNATQYRLSFMLYDQGTLQKKVIGDHDPKDYKTYSADLNLRHIFTKAGLTIGVDMKPYLVNNKTFGGDPWGNIQILSPLTKTYNSNGTYAPNSPMALFADTRGSYAKTFNFGNNTRLDLDLKIPKVKGLTATFVGNLELFNGNSKTWTAYVPTYNEDGTLVTATDPILSMTKNNTWNYQFNTGLKYKTQFANQHNLSAGLYYNQQEGYTELITATRTGYYDYVDQLYAGPTSNQTNSGSASESGRLGYVGVLDYDFMGKYIVGASFRYDGSDAYQKGERWGFFPSVSLGYVISDEKAIKDMLSSISVNFLKLRGSWGIIGETSNRFAYLSGYSLSTTGAYIGGTTVPTLTPGSLASGDLTWYTTKNWNIGIDFALFNNRLNGSADYFYRRTTGYLINPVDRYNATLGNPTGSSGFNYTYGLPKVKSDDAFRRAGAEFSLSWKEQRGNWNYSIGANLSLYDQLWEKYAAVDDAVTLANPNKRTTGVTLGQGQRSLVYTGLISGSSQLLNTVIQANGSAMMAGDAAFMDVNGDGQINDEDAIYNYKPRSAIMQYGVPFRVGYKSWFLDGLIQGTGSQYDFISAFDRGTGWNKIYYQYQLDIYNPGNTNASLPRADNDYGAWNGEYNRANSNLWLVNRTYVRLKNLNIGYDLKNTLFKNSAWFSSAKISLAGTNLFTISPAKKYFDPENGVDIYGYYGYPMTKTYSLVLNVSF